VLREHTVFEPNGSTELQGVQSPEVRFFFQRKKENKVSTLRSNTKAEGATQHTFASSRSVNQQTLPQLQPELQPLFVPQRFSPVVLCLAVGPKKRCTLVTQYSKERDYEWVQFKESTREVTQEEHIPRMGDGLLWSHVLDVVRGDLHSLQNVSPAPVSWTSFIEGGPRPFFRTSRKPHARFIQTICFADGRFGRERGEGTCPWSRLNSSGPSVLRATQALNERLVMSNAKKTNEIPCIPVLQEMFADLVETTTLATVKRDCMQPTSRVDCVFVDPDYQLSRIAAAIVAVVFDDEVEELCHDLLSSSAVAALRREDGLLLNWQGSVPLNTLADEHPCKIIRLNATGYLVQLEPTQSMAA